MTESTVRKGVQCSCGHFQPFSPWVYAHWTIEIRYTCPECKQQHLVIEGVSDPILKQKRRKKHV